MMYRLDRSFLIMAAIYSLVGFLQPTDAHAQGFQIGLNFTGMLGENNTFGSGGPPDTMGAVGPSEIIELINNSYSVYDKTTGGLIYRSRPDDFWKAALTANSIPPGNISQVFDPRIIYDASSQRWFATAVTRPAETQRLLVGVSNASDWLSGWKAVSFDATSFGVAQSEPWADFPRLGVNAEGVYVALFVLDEALGYKNGWTSIPKVDLLAAAPTNANATTSVYSTVTITVDGYNNLTPAVDFGPSTGRLPVITDLVNSTQLAHITNASGPGTAHITPAITIPTNLGGSFVNAPSTAPQPGTSALIETQSEFGATSNSVVVGNSVWYVRLVDQGGRSAIRWLEIDEANKQLLQSGVISDPELFLYDPSIAVNEFGDAVIGFSGSSPNQFASAYAVVGRTINGSMTFSDLTLLRGGLAPYLPTYAGPLRWGDYSATVLDPDDPHVFWTFQEFATRLSPSGSNWGIQISQIVIEDIPGDYNRDNVVDAADYIVWRKTDGTQAGYETWRAHFGQTAVSSVDSNGPVSTPTVPEPNTALVLITGLILLQRRFRFHGRCSLCIPAEQYLATVAKCGVSAVTFVFLFARLPAAVSAATWTAANPGDLLDGANWSGGSAPNGVGRDAEFTDQPTIAGDFTLNNAFTVGTFDYQNSQDRWIRGSGIIDFDVSSGNALLSVQNGDLAIVPDTRLNDHTEMRIATRADILRTISGTGGVIKTGDGYLYLVDANSYGGGTIIDRGQLIVGNTTGSGTGSGNVTINSGSLHVGSGGAGGAVSGNITNNGSVYFNRSDNVQYAGQISGSGSVAQYGAGILTLGGNNTYTGSTGVVDGTLRLGASERLPDTSDVYVYADCTLDLNNFNETIGSLRGEGNVTLGSGSLATGGNNLDAIFSGIVSGTGRLTKQSAGILELANANTYSGGTTINGGSVRATNSSGSATGPGDITINSGRLTIGFVTEPGSVSGNIINNGLVDFYQSFDSQYAGQISGTGYLIKEGSGTLTITGNNTYTGKTDIHGGTLKLGAHERLSNVSRVQVNGVLDLGGYTETIGSLSGTGQVILGTGALITGSDNTSTIFTGVMSGVGGLHRIGSGTLRLDGDNNYYGGTEIDNGAVLFNGANAGGPIVVNNGTLGGAGFIGTPLVWSSVDLRSRLAPGNNSIGTLTVNGFVSFQGGSSFDIEIAGRTAGAYDQLVVNNTLFDSGQVTLAGTLQVALLDEFTPLVGDSFQILFAAGGVSGAFSGISAPSSTTFHWQLVYTAQSVFLNAVAALPGDFNNNGIVDAADYVVWRKGTNPTQAGYDLWRTNFGNEVCTGACVGSGSSESSSTELSDSTANVPEPATLMLLAAAGALGLIAAPRRRRPE